MSNNKHTPGPWIAHYGWASQKLNAPDVEHPNWVEITGGSFENGDYLSVTGHVGIDNALLIAEAPNMLRELKRELAWLEHIKPQVKAPDSVMLGFEQAIKGISALIAKAEGRA